MLSGRLYIVGVGPGHHDHMTFGAKQVIEESDTIVGYATYVNLVEDLIRGKEIPVSYTHLTLPTTPYV